MKQPISRRLWSKLLSLIVAEAFLCEVAVYGAPLERDKSLTEHNPPIFVAGFFQDPSMLRPRQNGGQNARDGGTAIVDAIRSELSTAPIPSPILTTPLNGVAQVLAPIEEAKLNLANFGGKETVIYADQLIQGWVDTPRTSKTSTTPSRVFTKQLLLELLERGVQKGVLFGEMPSHTLTAKILRIDGNKRQGVLSAAKTYIETTIEGTRNLKTEAIGRATFAAQDGGAIKLASTIDSPITTSPVTATPISATSPVTTAPTITTVLNGTGQTAVETLPAVPTVTNIATLPSAIVTPATLTSLQHLLELAGSEFQKLPALDYQRLFPSVDVLQDLGLGSISTFQSFTLPQFHTASEPFKLLAAGQVRFDARLNPSQFKLDLTPGELKILNSSPEGRKGLAYLGAFENQAQRILVKMIERSAPAGGAQLASVTQPAPTVQLPEALSAPVARPGLVAPITATSLMSDVTSAMRASNPQFDLAAALDVMTSARATQILEQTAPDGAAHAVAEEIVYKAAVAQGDRGALSDLVYRPLLNSLTGLAKQAELQHMAVVISPSIFDQDVTLTQQGFDSLLKITEGKLFFLPRDMTAPPRLNIPRERVVSQFNELAGRGINGTVVAFVNHADRLRLVTPDKLLVPNQTLERFSGVTVVEAKGGASAMRVVDGAFKLAAVKGEFNNLDAGTKSAFVTALAEIPASSILTATIHATDGATRFVTMIGRQL